MAKDAEIKVVVTSEFAIHAHFIPNEHGGFIDGVPARDLSKEEWLALPKETRDLCRSTGLYQLTASQKDIADG